MASIAQQTGTVYSAPAAAADPLVEGGRVDEEEPSPVGVALRYLGLLVLTLGSAIAISGYAPADVVVAAGL